MSPVRLIVDTDTAGDDVASLLIALRHPNAQLEAITVCCGNVSFEQQVENALYSVEKAGRGGEVPVFPGCQRPLLREWAGAEYVHGKDGMGDNFFPPAHQRPEEEHGVDALVRLVNASPGDLTILAQAPLTNVAAVVLRDPGFAQKVKRLVIMGGGIGNITPAAEYNFYVDPEAAKIVFGAGFQITLFTWTLALSHGVFDDAKLKRLATLGSELSRFYEAFNRRALEFERKTGIQGTTHPDSMACAAIVAPELVLSSFDCFVDVETQGELTRGYSAIDRLHRYGREPNATVVDDFDNDGFFELMLEVLR
jgi:inosine-uridine nucleoside N-ribohydrolase